MSIWTELACLLASISLVSSISVCLEVFPNVFCQVCLKVSLDVFLDQPNIFLASFCPMGLISVVGLVLTVSALFQSKLTQALLEYTPKILFQMHS